MSNVEMMDMMRYEWDTPSQLDFRWHQRAGNFADG
jgi:hypothetical protein